jgi:hypothetical protein
MQEESKRKKVPQNAREAEQFLEQAGFIEKRDEEVIRSPRGLLTNRRSYGWAAGFRLEQTGPGQYEMQCPSSRDLITENLAAIRKEAIHSIKSDGEDPANLANLTKRPVLDVAHAGGELLQNLNALEGYIRRLDQNSATPVDAWDAILEAINLAGSLCQLTIVTHETAVDGHEKAIRGGSIGGERRAKKLLPRNLEMAEEYKQRRPGSKKKPTALMTEIGKKRGLGRSESIRVIKKTLQILSGNQGT